MTPNSLFALTLPYIPAIPPPPNPTLSDLKVQEDVLKRLLKDAVREVLHEERDMLYELVATVLEDLVLMPNLEEGVEDAPRGVNVFAAQKGLA
ncbi:MAG: hypothetical protein AAF752_01035 [Bacteroidota bacterium]